MHSKNHYRQRIQKALVYIDNHLTGHLSALDIAQAAHFSHYHFHRLFSAYMGEPVHKYVLSRRMEQSAHRLREDPDTPLIEIALSVGYETHSAFSRAFRSHFGESPTAFRQHRQVPGADQSRPYLLTVPAPSIDLIADIRSTKSLTLHYRVTTSTVNGQFFAQQESVEALQRLWDLYSGSLLGLVSSYPASPRALNDESAEAWFGGLTPPDTPIGWAEFEHQLEAGDWAVSQYQGDYRYLHQTWSQIYRAWLPQSGWTLRHELSFEKYLTDPRQTVPANSLVEIWLPVAKTQDRNSSAG